MREFREKIVEVNQRTRIYNLKAPAAVFHRNHANFPWRSHADWFLKQMIHWRQCNRSIDIEATADRVYRTDIFRSAAAEMGLACPDTDRLPPGAHGEPLMPSPPSGSCWLGSLSASGAA